MLLTMQCYNVLKMLFIISSLPAINKIDNTTATIHYRVPSRLQVFQCLHMFLLSTETNVGKYLICNTYSNDCGEKNCLGKINGINNQLYAALKFFLCCSGSCSMMPVKASKTNAILNTRCWFHVMFCNTPPQEHGT